MKFAALTLASSILPLGACDLCAVYSVHQANGDRARGIFLGISEQYTYFGTLQENGKEIANPAGQYLKSSVVQTFLGYNFNDSFGAQINAPFLRREYLRADGLTTEKGLEKGLGDSSLLLRWTPLRKETRRSTFSWNLNAGVKVPTGDTGRLQEEVNELSAPPLPAGGVESGIHGHDLSLGTGSFDAILGTAIYLRYGRAFVQLNAQYFLRTKGDYDYRYANDLNGSVAPGVFLLLNEHHTFALQLAATGAAKGYDTFRGTRAEDTAVTSVYLGPKITYTWSDRLHAEAGIDIPLVMHNSALQSVPDYRIQGAFSWHF